MSRRDSACGLWHSIQHSEEIAVLVREQDVPIAQRPHACAPKLRAVEHASIPGQQNPRRGEGRRKLARVVHAHAVESHRPGIRRDHRLEVDVSVRDVDGQDGIVVPQVPRVDAKGLERRQMNRHRVSREGIDRQQVELLRLLVDELSFQDQPRVALDDVRLSRPNPRRT